jgi:DNA polymerase III delta prime subunit
MSICEIENVNLESEAVIDKLIKITEGDLRRSINTLQTCASFKSDDGLSIAQVDSISGVVPKKAVIMVDTVLSTRGATYADI